MRKSMKKYLEGKYGSIELAIKRYSIDSTVDIERAKEDYEEKPKKPKATKRRYTKRKRQQK